MPVVGKFLKGAAVGIAITFVFGIYAHSKKLTEQEKQILYIRNMVEDKLNYLVSPEIEKIAETVEMDEKQIQFMLFKYMSDSLRYVIFNKSNRISQEKRYELEVVVGSLMNRINGFKKRNSLYPNFYCYSLQQFRSLEWLNLEAPTELCDSVHSGGV